MSTIIHGVLLLVSVVLLARVLRLTPLASLATILILVGFKLTKPALYRTVFAQGWDQFIPFLVTLFSVVFVDLLTGSVIGFACGLFFVIRTNHHEAISVVNQDSNYLLRFTKDASFINKNEFRRKLRELPDGAHVVIDGSRALFVDNDILEIADDFRETARHKNIEVDLRHWNLARGGNGSTQAAAAGQ
jgi:MFS superfamily sulfate permease-like transporter